MKHQVRITKDGLLVDSKSAASGDTVGLEARAAIRLVESGAGVFVDPAMGEAHDFHRYLSGMDRESAIEALYMEIRGHLPPAEAPVPAEASAAPAASPEGAAVRPVWVGEAQSPPTPTASPGPAAGQVAPEVPPAEEEPADPAPAAAADPEAPAPAPAPAPKSGPYR